MYCNEPGTTQCYTVLPAEGTPCGNGKVSIKSKVYTSVYPFVHDFFKI